MTPCLQNIDVAILCGGMGTRIAPVLGDTPKCLAPVGGHPFMHYLLYFLTQKHGARKIILCTAHGADAILDWTSKYEAPVIVSVEDKPTGTAGAIRAASAFLTSNPVLICNGDTLIDCDDFEDFVLRFDADYCTLMLRAESYNNQCYPSGFTLVSQHGLETIVDSTNSDLTSLLKVVDHRRDTRKGSYFDIGVPEAYARTEAWLAEHPL